MEEQNSVKEAAKIRILIVDNYPMMRIGTETTSGMTTIAQTGSGEEPRTIREVSI
ncbi:MAG TPA: hypothetical protein VHD85_03185 [Terracidiphilus sp.]|nr:hypothetical protein [Terracidiphilus sp.]